MNRLPVRLFAVLIALLLVQPAVSETLELPKPKQTDTCPVCGMFVSKYPSWIATVQYKDGHLHHFDGAKDMFKYLLDLPKWAPNHRKENITDIGVTEYYALQMIDAKKAFYVIGSEVYGPMGHELVPFLTKEDAEEFKRDHKGVRIMKFDEVKMKLLLNLDDGEFTD